MSHLGISPHRQVVTPLFFLRFVLTKRSDSFRSASTIYYHNSSLLSKHLANLFLFFLRFVFFTPVSAVSFCRLRRNSPKFHVRKTSSPALAIFLYQSDFVDIINIFNLVKAFKLIETRDLRYSERIFLLVTLGAFCPPFHYLPF